MDGYLSPPARFSHGVALALSLGVVVLIGSNVGSFPTIALGLLTIGAFLGALEAFDRDVPLSVFLGGFATIFGGIGIVVTPLVGYALVIDTYAGFGVPMAATVPLVLLGGLAIILVQYVPDAVLDEDLTVAVSLFYAAVLFTVLAVVGATIQIGLVTVLDQSASSAVRDLIGGLEMFVTVNSTTRGAVTAFLAGVCLALCVRLVRLPLVRRLHRWAGRRGASGYGAEIDITGDPSERASTASSDDVNENGDDTADLAGEGAEKPTEDGSGERRRQVLGWTTVKFPTPERMIWLIGTSLMGLGLIGYGIGLSLTTSPQVAGRSPLVLLMDELFGGTIVPQTILAWVLLGLIGIRVVHVILWRFVHIDWATHRRRILHLTAPVALIIGIVLLVTIVGQGDSLVRVTIFAVDAIARQLPDQFSSLLRALHESVGVPVLLVAFLGVVLDLAVVLLMGTIFISWLGQLSRPGFGFGFLFGGTVGASVLGIPPLVAFVAAAVSLLAWDLHTVGRSLARQLDSAARTLRGELVHLGESLSTVIVVVVLTIGGAWATRFVPTPDEQWQVFAVLLLSVLAATVSLVALGLRADQ